MTLPDSEDREPRRERASTRDDADPAAGDSGALASFDRQLLENVIHFLAEPVFVKDNEHRVVHANQAFYDMFRLDESIVLGSTLAEAVPPHEREHFLAVDRAVLDTGVADLREEELTVEGHTYTIVTSKRRYITDDGRRFLIGSIQDITAIRESERKLKAEKEQLEAALQEIRTLKGIIPICSYCKKIRDDRGAWQQLEKYITAHSDAAFSHGICEDCQRDQFPDYWARRESDD